MARVTVAAMIRVILAAAILVAVAPAARAQIAKIPISLVVRSEGRADRDAASNAVHDAVRKGLEGIADVELVPSDGTRRTVWIIVGTAAGQHAASLMVTERYDRETLMVLGIEDDDMAHRMMALQIVADHQIFTAASDADLARRIVTAVDTGALARIRKLPQRLQN
jgi:hypothetical protein